MLNQPIILKPSYWLVVFLLAIYLGAAIVVICLAFAWFVILPILVLLSISLIKNIRRYALQLANEAIIEVWPKNNNEWLLKTKQGIMQRAELLQSSYCSIYLVVLNFKLVEKKAKVSVVILPDSLERNTLRRLRGSLLLKT